MPDLARVCIQQPVSHAQQEARVAWVYQELDQALQQRHQASSIPPACDHVTMLLAMLLCGTFQAYHLAAVLNLRLHRICK